MRRIEFTAYKKTRDRITNKQPEPFYYDHTTILKAYLKKVKKTWLAPEETVFARISILAA